MIEGVPTSWAAEIWAAAKTAGPFGNMLLLIIVIVLWRKLNAAQAAILSLTVDGLKAMAGIEAALKGIRGDRARRGSR